VQDSGEAVQEAAKSTGNVLQKAGQAAADAAKKTWNCITSLFGSC
jgi:molybdenum cofactor biosynthesis enzyme